MRIFRHVTGLDAAARGSAVAIGNFDGVHLGHQAVIAAAGQAAQETGAPHAVLTFEPHPRSVFRPETPPFRLTPFRTKARQIEALGAELLFVLHFDLDFAKRTAEAFVEEILVGGLGAAHVAVGEDFVFGRGRAGTSALLEDLARRSGFGVTTVAPVAAPGGAPYSSTRIRDLLAAGRPAEAAALLGRAWEIEGRVEAGERRGHQLGFPTANLTLGEHLPPATGVYAVRAGIERAAAEGTETSWHAAVANLGHRPTFGGDGLLLEVHILDFSEDLYGRHLRVALIEHLRPEKKFDGLEGLRAQIAEDSRRARDILSRRGAGAPAKSAATGPRASG